MKKSKTVSKIFFVLSGVFFVCAFIFLFAHTFYENHYFNAVHNYHNPQSEFITNDKPDTSILLVSDTGSANILLREIINDAFKSHRYDFVMYLGDMTKNASVTSYYWMLDSIKPVLNGTPLYTIPGNHEITRRIGLTKKHFKDKSFYETVMGQRYYWFGYGNTLFVTLDSSDETMDERQLVWLDDTLKKIRPLFKNCIIFGHVPPADSRSDFFAGHITKPETTKRFEQIIKKYKINAMFFGHVHFFSKGQFANIDFYTTPSSGQAIRDPENRRYGYINLNINKNGVVDVEPHFIEFDGKKYNAFMEWFVRDVLSEKVCMMISTSLWLALAALVVALFYRPRSSK